MSNTTKGEMPLLNRSLDHSSLKAFKKRSENFQNRVNNMPISSYFGELTFGLGEMRDRLPKDSYQSFLNSLNQGKNLTSDIADVIAGIIKDWAVSKGVTHFCHWFQPMTGSTAEKHDAFITIQNSNFSELSVMERFSGSQLAQGEPDASSLPSGGSRTTFEARGYTAWDISSPIFILEGEVGKTLCIPSVYFGYHGEALDFKTPLLRSSQSLSNSAAKFLKLIGDVDVKKIIATLGAEQEYFLIDAVYVAKRPDLVMTGRTLIGANASKGQQLEDHYFGSVPNRIKMFWEDAEYELYRLGIPVKTRHNEVAPSQFEMAPIFEDANIATDHNSLTMEILKNVAKRHGFVCLLNEKPFNGLNGSGKHCNWSMKNDKGENLLEPGKTPHQNLRFLAMVAIIVDAVNNHADMLRASIASFGNDFRLGANEAPPAIISVFLGRFLEEIFETLGSSKSQGESITDKIINLGIEHVPEIARDSTDRNRTSPFAFTGNRFEFRAPGATTNVAMPVTVLNAAVANSFEKAAARLNELIEEGGDRNNSILKLISELYNSNKQVIFSGNNYSDNWVIEAEKRGLPHYPSSVEAFDIYKSSKSTQFLVDTNVFTLQEIDSRYNLLVERYITTLDIEIDTFIEMISQFSIASAEKQLMRCYEVGNSIISKNLKESHTERTVELELAHSRLLYHLKQLKEVIKTSKDIEEESSRTKFLKDKAIPHMETLRQASDFIELNVADELWILPRYREMLFANAYTY